MEETVNQEVVNPRDQLVDRMRTRYPDRNFDVTDGTDGTAGTNGLEQSIIDALTEDETRINEMTERQKTYDDNTGKLTALFNNSPRAAVFLNTLAASGDPSAAIYKAYGQDAYEAFRQGDASELIASIEAEDAKNRADNEQYEAEKEENIKASIQALDEWGNAKGLDEEQKVATFMRFYEILSDALVGKYATELYDMAWKADHYDEDVASARHEGEVTGRNAKIKEMASKRNMVASMPPALQGQGGSFPERQTSREKQWGDYLND